MILKKMDKSFDWVFGRLIILFFVFLLGIGWGYFWCYRALNGG